MQLQMDNDVESDDDATLSPSAPPPTRRQLRFNDNNGMSIFLLLCKDIHF